MPKPKIDASKCEHCGVCVDICPVQVFEKKGEKVVITKPGECLGCRACEMQCSRSAIVIED